MSNTTPPSQDERSSAALPGADTAATGPCVRSVSRGSSVSGSTGRNQSSRNKSSRATAGQPWYREGLKFACKWPECRACCQGDEGYIWVSDAEVEAIAASLGMTPANFMRRHTTIVMGQRTLIERDNGDCTLLGPDGCTVYDVRPGQCRSYPFWPEIIESRKAWKAERKYCPGIDEGEHHDVETIEARKRLKPRSPWATDAVVEPIDGSDQGTDG